MAGRKQHFIPQAVQRGFEATRGKKTQVYVFRKGQAPYLSSTEGVAAQRDFYSAPSSQQSLDDSITEYEGAVLAPAVAALRESPAGPIDSEAAAAVVVHLSIRAAFIRGTFSTAATELLKHLTAALGSHATTRALLDVDTLETESMLVKSIEDEIRSNFPELPQSGKDVASKLMHFRAREKFPQMFPNLAANALKQFGALMERLPELIGSAHSKALEKDLVPAHRVERLKGMNWQIIAAPGEAHFLLPDCLALASKVSGFTTLEPYFLLGDEELVGVVMPISSSKVLVGGLGASQIDVTSLNRSFAQCSFEFFISSKKDAEALEAAQLIGSTVSQFVGTLLEDQAFAPPRSSESEEPKVKGEAPSVSTVIRFEPVARKSGKAQTAVRNLLTASNLQDGLRIVECVVVADNVVRSLRQRGVQLDDLEAHSAKLGTCHVFESQAGLRCQLFVPRELVDAVVRNTGRARHAAALIRYQAGRATYFANLVGRVPSEVMQRPRPLLEAVTLRIAQFFSSHYFGGRLSHPGEFSEAEFSAAETLYSQSLANGMREIERARQHFIEHRDVNAALSHALTQVKLVLIATAIACATTPGRAEKWKSSASFEILRGSSLGEWFGLFAHDLERYFDSRAGWTGDDELRLLAGHVERVLWSSGILLSTKVSEEIWMDVVTEAQLAELRVMLKA